jgi:hypothetical protein
MEFIENSQSNIKRDSSLLFGIFEQEIHKYYILLFYTTILGHQGTDILAYEDKK